MVQPPSSSLGPRLTQPPTVRGATRELSFAGIRLRHPSASEDECRLHYALLTLGRSLACKAYPEAKALVAR